MDQLYPIRNPCYTLRKEGADTLFVSITGDLAVAPGKIILQPPLVAPLVQVEVNGENVRTFDTERVVINRCPAEIRLKMALSRAPADSESGQGRPS